MVRSTRQSIRTEGSMEVKRKVSNRSWQQAGEVYVDAGCVMVSDPCYVLPRKSDSDPGLDYEVAVSLDRPEDAPDGIDGRMKRLREGDLSSLKLPAPDKYRYGGSVESFVQTTDMEGAFLIPSGYGDGAYPIYVLVSDEGDWGTRIMGLFVDFDGSFDASDLPEFGSNSDETWGVGV